MTEPVDHPVWSDERIESLLREFFRNEMPAELRHLPDAPPIAAPPAQHVRMRPRRGSLAGVVAAATAVAAVWVALMLQAPVGEEHPGAGPDSKSRASVAEDSDSGPAPLDQLERPGVRQPVERRSRGGIQHVDAPALEIEYPEWEADIRYYGVDEDDKEQKRKSGDRD